MYIHVCTFQLYLLASVFTSSAPIDCSCLHKVSHDRFYPILLDPPRSHLVPEKYLLILVYFCHGTGVPRHSAGGVGSFICMYAMRMWHSKSFAINIATYQNCEYIIRTMNTKHACSAHLLYIPYCIHTGFLAPNCTQDYKLALNTAWRSYQVR